MNLRSSEVVRVLQEKGASHVFHANSVVTSCNYLRERALLSRGRVSDEGLPQSPQSSDTIDKRKSIWFDVFFDSVDIHKRASNANIYGPVLFVFDLAILERRYTGNIWVTKLNPTKWSATNRDNWWFGSVGELEREFVVGNFDQMIVLRHCGGRIGFGDSLQKMVLDDPLIEAGEVDYYSQALGALRISATLGKQEVDIEKRKCVRRCACRETYLRDDDQLDLLFLPTVERSS